MHLFYVCLCAVVISKAMADITRPLIVGFAMRHYARLGHEEILESLKDNLEWSDVKAIQLTETSCYVTISTRGAKESLLSSGVSVRNMYNSVYDVEQVITNVTIKDARFELSDGFLIYHMKTYGDVIENSLKRGKIKGTEIETGTRYIQMVNVRDVLPTVVNLGRFRVRIYSDNKTECRICKDIGHPFSAVHRKMICHLEFVSDAKAQSIEPENDQMTLYVFIAMKPVINREIVMGTSVCKLGKHMEDMQMKS